MIVTITEYREIAADIDGTRLPLGGARQACNARTSAGAFPKLDNATRFVRLATDTAIRVDIAGGATDTADELFMPGVEFFAVAPGTTLSITVA